MCFVCAQHYARSGEHENHIELAGDSDANILNIFTRVGTTTTSPTTGSNEWTQYIDTIYRGLTWGGNTGQNVTVTYSFDVSGADDSIVFASPTNFTSAEQTAARKAMTDISKIAGVTFQEAATSSAANIHFYRADFTENVSGLAGFLFIGSRLVSATVGMDDIAEDFSQVGSFGYYVLLHEIGHALGLKHSGNNRAGDTGPFLPENLDKATNTVMSYEFESNNFPTVMGPLDVTALRFMYGLGTDGADTPTGTTTTAQNLTGTDGADNLTGSALNDTVTGGLGNDTLNGLFGNDSINGGGGDDAILAGQGADSVNGGDGNDRINGGRGRDVLDGGAGNDVIYGANAATPQDAEDSITGGAGNDNIFGNGGYDTLDGGDGNDDLFGGAGDDSIIGGAGNDTLGGAIGSDTLTGGDGADIFIFANTNGSNIITDFTIGDDRLRILNNLDGSGVTTPFDILAAASVDGGDTVITLGDTIIRLQGVTDSLSATDVEVSF